MLPFEGKKLLMLGSSTMARQLVEYARTNGAYVIVTDCLPLERSPAKPAADEAAMIDTADTDALVAFARERNVDGVMAGISEFNLLQAQKVSEKLGLRFYFDRRQWDAVSRKDQFRKLCIKRGIPCPKTYFWGTENELTEKQKESFVYPLVVKPTDCSASVGVSICKCAASLESALKKAFELSESGRIIVEQFISGHEFTAHFVVNKGKAALACIDNRYPVAIHDGDVTTIPAARIYPALFEKRFSETVSGKIVRLCESLGLQTAVMFVQGFYEPAGGFYLIEAGLRSAAESPCRYIERLTGQNYLHMLIDYILTGSSDYDVAKERPDMLGKCCGIISLITTGGMVGTVSGVEECARSLSDVIEFENRYPPGTVAPSGDTLHQLMIRFSMICSSREQIRKNTEYINAHVIATDAQGNDMLIRIAPERLSGLDDLD